MRRDETALAFPYHCVPVLGLWPSENAHTLHSVLAQNGESFSNIGQTDGIREIRIRLGRYDPFS